MKSPQRGSAAVLLSIVIILLVVILGLYIYFQSRPSQETVVSPSQTEISPTAAPSTVLTDDAIAQAIGTSMNVTLTMDLKGSYEFQTQNPSAPLAYFSLATSSIYRGELDQKGYEDALVVGTECNADCGQILFGVINNNGTAEVIRLQFVGIDNIHNFGPNMFPPGQASADSIQNIRISNRNVAITYLIPLTNSVKILDYIFVDNQLIYAPPISVSSPKDGDVIVRGNSFLIQWIPPDSNGVNVLLETFDQDGNPIGQTQYLASAIDNVGTFNWTPQSSLDTSHKYKIKITKANALGFNASDSGESSGYFTLK